MTAAATLSNRRPGFRRSSLRRSGYRRSGYRGSSPTIMIAFAAPCAALLLIMNLYPFLYAGMQSVHDGTLVTVGQFVGLQNYADMLTRASFWDAAGFTVVFTLVGVFGSWLVGLGAAMLLNAKVPGGNVFKVLLLLPWVIPIVVSTTSWNWLVATPTSPLPLITSWLGLGDVLFLVDPTLARLTVCAFKVWHSFPFMMMMMSAALASVDRNIYEAARVDGGGPWRVFGQITLPMISRSIYVSWILMTIFAINDFPTVYLLTDGGPMGSTTTLVVLAYATVFKDMQVGAGVAIAFLMTLVMVVVSVVLYRQIRKGPQA